MNKQRRKALAAIVAKLREASEAIDTLKADVGFHYDDEQAAYDSMPESLQAGAPGEKAQAATDSMEEACDSLQEAMDALDAACDAIDTATA